MIVIENIDAMTNLELRMLRAKYGLSQAELSELADIHRLKISNLEKSDCIVADHLTYTQFVRLKNVLIELENSLNSK